MTGLWFTDLACEGLDALFAAGVPQGRPLAVCRALDELEEGRVARAEPSATGLEALEVIEARTWIVFRREGAGRIVVVDVRDTPPPTAEVPAAWTESVR